MASGDRLDEARNEPKRSGGFRERKEQQTRGLIAGAALELFLERGYEAVTVADVAERSKIHVETIYNHFPSRPDLVYRRFEDFKHELLTAIGDRKAGESVLAVFSRFLVPVDSTLADSRATARLHGLHALVSGSPVLLAHEDRVYARFSVALAGVLAAETGRRDDIEPSVVAHALIGLHRFLVSYTRAETLAGKSNTKVAREVRRQAKRGVELLARGFGDYGAASSDRRTLPGTSLPRG